LQHEFFGEEGINESQVVVYLANLEDFLAPQTQLSVSVTPGGHIGAFLPLLAKTPFVCAVFDEAEEFDTQLIGVELASGSRYGAGVVVGVVNHFGRFQYAALRHYPTVPIGGPAFVHNLRLALGQEVVAL
jgi:hypothetical protein